MTLFFNSSTVNAQKASIITLTCVPVLLNFFAFTMLVLKNILQLLNKTHNLIVLLSAWLGEEHSDETFRRRVSKNSRSPLFSSCLNFSANKNYFSWNLLLTFIGRFLWCFCSIQFYHKNGEKSSYINSKKPLKIWLFRLLHTAIIKILFKENCCLKKNNTLEIVL